MQDYQSQSHVKWGCKYPITANDSWRLFCKRQKTALKFSLSGQNPLSVF